MMILVHPSFQIFNIRDAFRLIAINLFHFSIYRFVFLLVLIPVIGLIVVSNTLFRMADEILFYHYRKVQIKNPVFIISTPRSGTTLLLNLLSRNSELFVTPKLYQTIISSISFRKIIHMINYISFGGLYKLSGWIDKKLFKSWEGIHPMGFGQPEEDEGFWFFSFYSPALSLLTPFYDHFSHLNIPDYYSVRNRKILSISYKSFLKKICFTSPDSRLLVKSVLSCGRLDIIHRTFPDARFILIRRPLNEAAPSYVNMFTKPWDFHSPDANEEQREILKESIYSMNNHLEEIKTKIPSSQILELKYALFIQNPMDHIKSIYEFLQITADEVEINRLDKEIERSKLYVRNSK